MYYIITTLLSEIRERFVKIDFIVILIIIIF